MKPRSGIARGIVAFLALSFSTTALALDVVGLSVTPHRRSPNLRYRRPSDPQLGARVEVFLRNEGPDPLTISSDFRALFDGRTPQELLKSGDWAWHDTPSARGGETIVIPAEALTAWTINSRSDHWGVGTTHRLTLDPAGSQPLDLRLEAPRAWLSAVTFLGQGEALQPTRAVVHVANDSDQPLTLRACRLWLPASNAEFRVLRPRPWQTNLASFPASGLIPAREKGGFRIETGPLPLTYGAIEVEVSRSGGKPTSLWAHLRIKREMFDRGGGWVASRLGTGTTLQAEPYLKTLRRMHINAGMHEDVPGYSDTPLFPKYPLKYMNRLQPFDRYDNDAMLPRIHAVEFQGEPQYGGGRPVPPQEVFTKFLPYGRTRLPTSVTHSEERVWRYYAGLSDYPHFDAYRVTAPSPDAWAQYDRWGAARLRWGAPLETIADMTQSLRELNRPRPIACWSQGAHDGWERYGGRPRTSPTPDELRAQAYHALGQRVTSLYWFNLSLNSLRKFRDLIDPITRVNREIRLMEDLLLEGDNCEFRRELVDRQPSWDLASVAGPTGALLFASDLMYVPDDREKVFRFASRDGVFTFNLPAYLSTPAELFRLDANGTHDVDARVESGRVIIRDRVHVAGIYVASARTGLRQELQKKHGELIAFERSFSFDPAGNDADFEVLKRLAP
ncbi:MAG: hypothetical protein U0794_18820 [Isosphaeraceae bacterium]